MKAFWLSGFLCLLCSTSTTAITFLSFDPQSMAMGGTGVAFSGSHNAALFNPALIVMTDAEQKTTRIKSFLGVRVIDRSNFLGGLYQYQDNNAEASFDRSWLQMERQYSQNTLEAGNIRRVARTASQWRDDIDGLSDRPLHISGSFGLTLSQSDGFSGSGIYIRQYSIGGGIIRLSEQNRQRIDQGIDILTLMADIVDGAEEVNALGEVIGFERLENLIDDAAETGVASPELESYYDYPKVEPLVEASIELGRLAVELDEYFELDRLRNALVNGGNLDDLPDLQQYLRYQTDEELDATIYLEGVDVTELGLSFASQIEQVEGLTLGTTFKYVELDTIDFSTGASRFSLSQMTDKRFQQKHNMLNADLGISYRPDSNYSLGLVVKNIIAREFETILGKTIQFRPIARLGMAHAKDDLVLSAELDLTTNDAKGFDPDKRYLSLGAEYTGWNSAKLRAGMRIDTQNGTYTPSLGIGFGDKSSYVDLALTVAPKYDELGGAIQAVWSF
ncbi:MAG: conjugal transfer protein TraF [Porticoccaceae bacterium]